MPRGVKGASGMVGRDTSSRGLAPGAEIRAPGGNDLPHDGCATAGTGCFPVDGKELLEVPLFSRGTAEIPDGGSLRRNCHVEDFADGGEQAFLFLRGKGGEGALRMEACVEENLTGVDVTDTGNGALVKEEVFEASFPPKEGKESREGEV